MVESSLSTFLRINKALFTKWVENRIAYDKLGLCCYFYLCSISSDVTLTKFLTAICVDLLKAVKYTRIVGQKIGSNSV